MPHDRETLHKLQAILADAVLDLDSFRNIGGTDGEFGQIVFRDVTVIVYPVGDKYEVDIAASGGAIGMDVPKDKISIKSNDDRAATS